MLPVEYYWKQRAHARAQELEWTRTREILAMLHNQWAKTAKSGKQLVPLSLDNFSNFAVKEPDWQKRQRFRDMIRKRGRIDNLEGNLTWPRLKT